MAKISEEFIRLYNYVLTKPDGATLDYDTVQRETGVSMAVESNNRNKLAQAIRKSKRHALCYPGLGYELDDAGNTPLIVDRAGKRVFNQIKSASEITKTVYNRHAKELSEDERQRIGTITKMYSFLERKTITIRKIEVETVKEIPMPDINARK